MVDQLTTGSQHITSLSFDITKAYRDLEALETRFNQSMRKFREQANVPLRFTQTGGISPIGQVTSEMNRMTMMESQFRRRMSWFFTGSIFFGAIAGATQLISTMRDVETAVMKIGRVMEDATFQTNAYKEELLDLASEYGQDFSTVAEISLRYAQAGYNVKESLVLTRTSLLAVNAAELDIKNSTESLIGIMAQWNLQASDLPLVLDKINKTGDDFTVTSQDLVDGLLRSSQAARVMGMSIDQTIATLTVMREASGRTGREVGKNSVAPIRSNPVRKLALNSGKAQRWVIVSQVA